jgi:hypothetical protein
MSPLMTNNQSVCGRHIEDEIHQGHATAAPGQNSIEIHDLDAGRPLSIEHGMVAKDYELEGE